MLQLFCGVLTLHLIDFVWLIDVLFTTRLLFVVLCRVTDDTTPSSATLPSSLQTRKVCNLQCFQLMLLFADDICYYQSTFSASYTFI